MTRSSHEEGFTLLEVLVAFVILAGAIVVSFRTFGEGLSRLNDVERHTHAAMIARRELSRLELSEQLISGTATGTEHGFTWITTLSPLGTSEGGTVIPFRAVITIKWDQEPDRSIIEVESVLLAVIEN